MKKEKMMVSPRQMVINSVLLLVANFFDELVSKIGYSLGVEEIGVVPAIAGMENVFRLKWLVCFTLIFALLAAWRKPKVRWFLAQVVFLVAVFLLLAQLYHITQILPVHYFDQILSFLIKVKLFVKGLPGQS